jgi:acyl-coenzyme A synthetase/AMP-(fatty) acid ligase
MIANFIGNEIRPGSMGRPLPGVEATILRRDQNGRIEVDGAGAPIEVVRSPRASWPYDPGGLLCFRAIWAWTSVIAKLRRTTGT